jgi:isoamylase
MAGPAIKQDESQALKAAFDQGEVRAGDPLPIGGAHESGDGVNFVLFSRNATRVRLELYQNADDSSPARILDLNPAGHRTGDIWHIWVRGIPAGQLYGYRIEGPYQPELGHRFNPHKLLLDPFARALAGVEEWDFSTARGYDSTSPLSDLSFSTVDNSGTTPKSVFTKSHFDWDMDAPPKHAACDMVIYETHVRGFTIDPTSGVAYPGTFRSLTEKIAYLKDLGVTAVELMPVAEFNESELVRLNPITAETLKNYWGYNPVAFFAPKQSYSVAGGPGQQVIEFREMVKELHRAGIEVILDIG